MLQGKHYVELESQSPECNRAMQILVKAITSEPVMSTSGHIPYQSLPGYVLLLPQIYRRILSNSSPID